MRSILIFFIATTLTLTGCATSTNSHVKKIGNGEKIRIATIINLDNSIKIEYMGLTGFENKLFKKETNLDFSRALEVELTNQLSLIDGVQTVSINQPSRSLILSTMTSDSGYLTPESVATFKNIYAANTIDYVLYLTEGHGGNPNHSRTGYFKGLGLLQDLTYFWLYTNIETRLIDLQQGQYAYNSDTPFYKQIPQVNRKLTAKELQDEKEAWELRDGSEDEIVPIPFEAVIDDVMRITPKEYATLSSEKTEIIAQRIIEQFPQTIQRVLRRLKLIETDPYFKWSEWLENHKNTQPLW